jgi:hypothetical protein
MMKKTQTHPLVDSMISGSKGLVVSVIKASPRAILVELYDPLKEDMQGEPDFLDRCIEFVYEEVESAMRGYATSS